MTAKLKVGVLVVLVLASSAAFAASANTSAEIDRSSNVNVVDDSNGLIGLQAGTSSGVVSDDSGQLSIDFTTDNATGVNANSTFTVGDNTTATDSTDSYAFNITNQDAANHDVTLGYTADTDDANTDPNIQFHAYNSTGSHLVTASEETDASVALSTGETAYVVIVVDTHGLGSGDDLTGTLTVSI